MKKLKLFFACLLMAVLSIGQVWATTTLVPVAAGDLENGDYLITATKSSAEYMLPAGTFAKGKATAASLTSSNYSQVWTFTKNGNAWDVTTSNGEGLGITATNNGVICAENAGTAFTISATANNATTVYMVASDGTDTRYLTLYKTDDWRCYKTTTNANTDQVRAIQLYKLEESGSGSGKTDVTDEQLAWSAENAEVTMGEEPYSFPSLTNTLGLDVTYQSTAEAVATIDANGNITLVKAGSTTIKAVFAGNETLNAKTVSYDLTVNPAPLTPIAGGIIDEIQISDLLTSGSGYQPFSDKQASNEGHSDAVYAGKVCISSTNIQMNTIGTNTSAGRSIATTTSGGNAKRVQAFWGGSNTADRKLTVYGSNTAYAGTETAASGTKLGDLTYASGDSYAYIDITGDYAYLQIVASGAIYMSQINITWVAPDVSKVATPEISGTANFYPSTSVSISCSTDDAAIYYTTDGTAPTSASTPYEGAFTVNADGTTTVKAIAVKDGMTDSDVAERTFTKATVLTVASALSAASGANVYVTGTITSITEVSIQHKNATYVISDVTAGVPANEMIIYRGKYVDGADFDSEDQIHVGDVVVVSGTIGVYQEKNQLAQGNQIESITPAAVVAPVFSPDGGGFMGETDVTITCATEGSAIYYTLDGTTPSKSSTLYTAAIHLTETKTITAIAYVGEESSLVVAKAFTYTSPMTVADAFDELSTTDPLNNTAVSGIVFQVDACAGGTYATYWISDDGTDAAKKLEIYHGYGLEGANFAANGIRVGDEVTVFGNLTIYKQSEIEVCREFIAGSRLLAFNRPQVDVESINLTESTAEVEEGKTVTLHASVVPANATNKTIVWSVQSGDTYASVDQNGVVTGIAAGEAVIRAASDEDATIFAECTVTVTEPAPLSPWATTYTSNVAMAHTGSGVDNGTITIGTDDPYLLVKAGASSSTGTIVVTVPKGTTDLHFHAFAWGGKTAKIELAGVENASVSEFDLAGEAGASGSGNDFTLQGDPVDQYFHVSFDAVAAETEITFSKATGSADNRFFFYGVNQEGGLILESISVSGTATALEYNEGDHFSPAGLGVIGHYSDASTAPITEGVVWAFDPDPLTEGTTSVSVTATAGGFTSDPFVVNGLTVSGAAPLSPWATVYTSNVTMAHTGSGVDNGTITIGTDDPYLLVKAGASSSTGTIVVTVPKGTTDLHFHAFAWGGKTAKIELAGVENASVSEFDLAGEAGASGSGNDFTLQSDPVDQYFHVSFDAVAAVTEITFSKATGSADNRFFFYGVNQEGGIVPVLKSIAISGDLDNKSYKAGQALDMTGLTVTATYQLGEETPYNVDITSDAGLTWTYAPLAEGDTQKEVTANFGGMTANKTIEGLTVASADPKIYVSTLNVNFASVEVGDAVPAAQTITVNLTNIASVTATLGGTNPEAFSISKTEGVVDGDEITISLLANTDAAASYAATLTISDGEGGADDKTVNLSFEVTEPVVEDDVTGTWTLVTNATTLAAGKKVIIAQYVEADGAINTMAGQASNNRSVIASTVAGATLTPTVGTKVMTLADAGEGNFYLKTSDGEYLYNASTSSKSYLRTKAEEENVSWTIAVDAEGVATITSVENTNRTKMRYNPNTSGSPLFNCYASGQEDIALYMLEEDTPEPTPDYTREVTNGHYGTICLPKAGTIEGATLYEIGAFENNLIYIDEVGTTLAAGVPYIFYASGAQLNVYYTDKSADDVPAGDANGLFGFYDLNDEDATFDIPKDAENYILYNDQYWLVSGRAAYIANYRAYIKRGSIVPKSAAPGRRRVAMAVNGENAATGFENIESGDKPMKVMIEGTMYILRGEKVYDATGRLVK